MNKIYRHIAVWAILSCFLQQQSYVQAALTVPEDVTTTIVYGTELPKSRHNNRINMCRRMNFVEDQPTISVQEESNPSTLLCVNTLGGRAFGEIGDSTAEIDLSEDVIGVTGVKGSDVISYAFQYVGNAYVWGGSSLTDGCDCSGYIMAVMEHFGIYFPHYSYDAVNHGEAISPENVRLGDVLIYNGGGHVALYMGKGLILEAEGAKWGIVAGQRAAFYTWDGNIKECVIRRYI